MSNIYDANGNVISTPSSGKVYPFQFSASFTEKGSNMMPTTDMYKHTERIPISEGDNIEYCGRIYNSSVCFIYNSDNVKIWESSHFNGAATDSGTKIAPPNSAYVICQTMTTTHPDWESHTPLLIVSGNIDVSAINNKMSINKTGTGNLAIRCAKEHAYADGSSPTIEYFLLEEPATSRFYFSRDMKNKEYAFTFFASPENYSFGIMQNGDVIAVRDASSLPDKTKDDTQRHNPFVFLASENWEIQHEIDFGSLLQPCGWLENCGFNVLPNGTTIFCEYTRTTVATANVWKIVGDITNPSNWAITKTFEVTTQDEISGFKHCHCIMHDQFTGVVYLTTGDDSSAAGIYYSTDSGSTWTQLGELSEKYCRLLNFIFTEQYIYWATDSSLVSRFLFRAERDSNGIIDWDSIEDYASLAQSHGGNIATYGVSYLPEINAILLLDRADSGDRDLPIRLVDLSDATVHYIATIKVPNNGYANIGFRTRFSEWYPQNALVRVGFDTSVRAMTVTTNNKFALFGNQGSNDNGKLNINNLAMQIFKVNDEFGIHFTTYYL